MAKFEFVNDGNFKDKVLSSSHPVLVDFYADWCKPCKMIEPWVEQVAQEFKGKIEVFAVNVDDSPLVAASYQILSIPTLLIFKDGAPVSSIIGAATYKVLLDKITSVLGGK